MPTPEEILQSGDLHGSLVAARYIEYVAGENIQINGNVISATDTDTTYQAGQDITITGTTISATPTIASNIDINNLFH